MSGTDHFSGVAAQYAKARPTYPPALYDWLSGLCPEHDHVWDVGCGNGQASLALAGHFGKVTATDISESQIASAPAHPKISYRVAEAHKSGLESQSADLVTIAQALHWFDLAAFYAEVRRVSKPEGIIAAWTYGKFELQGEALSALISHFYEEIIGPYWPAERVYPESGYATLSFPFQRMAAPAFEMRVDWSLEQMLGYFKSWSAVARYQQAHGVNPVDALAPDLAKVWGSDVTKPVVWPLTVLAARVHN